MDEALFGRGLRRGAAGQPGAEVAAPGDDGQQVAEHAMQRAALGVSGDEFAQAVEVGGDVGEQVGEAGEVGVVGRGGAAGNDGVSHEWLLVTGLNLPPSLPREGWQTVRVGRPDEDRQGFPPPARPAIDEAMRAAHAPYGREKAALGAATAPRTGLPSPCSQCVRAGWMLHRRQWRQWHGSHVVTCEGLANGGGRSGRADQDAGMLVLSLAA